MKTTAALSTMLPLFLVVGPVGGDEADAKKEIAKLAGSWNVTSLVYNGKDHDQLKLTFTFKGDEAVIEGNAAVKKEYARLKIKLDPTTMPKIMDMTVAGGVQKDAVIEGIYEIKGDELKICAKVFGKDRPGEFASPDGSSIVLMVLKKSP